MNELLNEIIEFSLNESTLKIVNEAFQSNDKYLPIDCEFLSFRLFKPNLNTVNLEYNLLNKYGLTFETSAQYFIDQKIKMPFIFFEGLKKNNVVKNDLKTVTNQL